MPARLHDLLLLDLLNAIEPQALDLAAFRATWSGRDPRLGNSAGGRWHPPSSFEALYASEAEDGALAEMYFHLSRAPVFSSSAMRQHRLAVRTRRTLPLLDMAALIHLGVDARLYTGLNPHRCQEIGAAAHFLEFDSLLAPSARWPCATLVLFLDRLEVEAAVTVEGFSEINWPAWRARQKPRANKPPV